MTMRVWEDGKSEWCPVMGCIGVATSPHAKAGRLPSGLPSQDGRLSSSEHSDCWRLLSRQCCSSYPSREQIAPARDVLLFARDSLNQAGEQHESICPKGWICAFTRSGQLARRRLATG
ncbi:hypothetical protein F6X42_14230 [Paraburkholderia sp. WC7.3b]|uniref:Uncharacterized protein n=1 Tax=Paraburkholderia podalyriae TaxID=1938811 RepID=A0ABR7PMX3_9BURK|nr:hypothetical protein [Paraburkholderia podalyriae]